MAVNALDIKIYEAPRLNVPEALRYAGCRGDVNDEIMNLYMSCIDEAAAACTFKVCYSRIPIEVTDAWVDFGFAKSDSKGLIKNLSGCKEVILFGATIGIGIDRLIGKYGKVSPSKGLMMQAIGAERIESLCDKFNEDVKNMLSCEGLTTKPRFSPGYGDMSLEFQKDIFANLNLQKNIGLFLNDSLLMSPSKSVTAIIGITSNTEFKEETTKKCANCLKVDCEFRR